MDATVLVRNAHSPDFEKVTALELKTGRELAFHKGQVLLYSLLLTERFVNSNNQNILLYLMSKGKTYYINTLRNEVCLLIQRRNELAKLSKISAEGKQYTLPPILDQEVCKNCYVNRLCSYYQMANEDKLEKEPSFKAYQEVERIADPVCLKYFKKWYEIIQLEQSAVNVQVSFNLNTSDRKAVKDEGLKITRVEPNGDEFFIYVERPYYNGSRQNSEITENIYVNLHTQQSISFTKGQVIKKHLIHKDHIDDDVGCDDDDDEGGMLDEDAEKTQKRKRRARVYLEYVLLFQQTNVINLERLAMGGVDYRECEWWIELETFSTFLFNIWRFNLHNLCIQEENER